MSELLQYDGTKMVDYGPSTPVSTPVSMADTSGKFVQVSDLRPGHPNAQTILTAAHLWPLPATDRPGKGSHEQWIPPLLLAKRRMWDGRRWMPGESTAKDGHPHADSSFTGSKLEFTQVLESGPSVGGPALTATSNLWTSAPRMRLFGHLKPPGHTGYSWVQYTEGTYHANNHHHVAGGMTKKRVPVAGKPDEYRWSVAIGSGVAKEIAGRHCFFLIDGEGEYGPFLVPFVAAVPWKIPSVVGLRAVAAGITSVRLTWNAVAGATSYKVFTGSTIRVVHGTSYVWTALGAHSTHQFGIVAVWAGGESAKAYASATTNPAPPLTGLHAVATSTTAIRLYWTAVPGATSYAVYLGATRHVVTSPTFTWGGLGVHHRYTFRVQGYGPGWSTAAVNVAQTTKAPVHVPTSHTVTVPDMWTGAYDQNHHRRSDHPSNPWQGDLVTGRYDTTHGNTYSLARFRTSVIPAGATVTSVKLRLYAKHWFANSGGSAKIYNVGVASTVRTRYTAKTGHITYMKWTTKTGYKEASIATTQAQKNAWRGVGGTVNAIQIGPPGNTSQSHYGVFAGSGSRKPRLIVKYTI